MRISDESTPITISLTGQDLRKLEQGEELHSGTVTIKAHFEDDTEH